MNIKLINQSFDAEKKSRVCEEINKKKIQSSKRSKHKKSKYVESFQLVINISLRKKKKVETLDMISRLLKRQQLHDFVLSL
jgi:hypothetical protein